MHSINASMHPVMEARRGAISKQKRYCVPEDRLQSAIALALSVRSGGIHPGRSSV